MADKYISKVSLPTGEYNIKDTEARTSIGTLTTALEAEVTRATGVEGGLDARIDALEAKEVTIKSDEKILAKNSSKELYTTLSVDIIKDSSDSKDYIVLKGINGVEVSRVDASSFVKDGMIESVTLDTTTTPGKVFLVITFNTAAGKEPIRLDVSTLIDVYTAGNGLELTGKAFSVKKDASSDDYLTVSSNGVKVSGIDDAISTAVADYLPLSGGTLTGNLTLPSQGLTIGDVTIFESELATWESRITTAESDIDGLETDVAEIKTDYLPLSAGVDKPLTGSLFVGNNAINFSYGSSPANIASIQGTQNGFRINTNAGGVVYEFGGTGFFVDGVASTTTFKDLGTSSKPWEDLYLSGKINNLTLPTGTHTLATTDDLHSHSNKAILDATTASYTTAEQTKLSGIETGAQVNKLEEVKLGGNFLEIKTDASGHGPYVDLGNIATTEGVLQGVDYVASTRTLTKTSGTGTTTNVHTFGALAEKSSASGTVAGQTITGVKATGSLSGPVSFSKTEVTASKVKTAGTLPTFTYGAFTPNTPTVIDTTKFNGGSQANLTTTNISYVEEGISAEVNETTETLVISAITPKSAKAVNEFTKNTVASLGTGFYTVGTAASKVEDTFTQGAMPTFDEVKADKVIGGTATIEGAELAVGTITVAEKSVTVE